MRQPKLNKTTNESNDLLRMERSASSQGISNPNNSQLINADTNLATLDHAAQEGGHFLARSILLNRKLAAKDQGPSSMVAFLMELVQRNIASAQRKLVEQRRQLQAIQMQRPPMLTRYHKIIYSHEAAMQRAHKGKQPLLAEQVNSNPLVSLRRTANKREIPMEKHKNSNPVVEKMMTMKANALQKETELMKKMPSVSTNGDGPLGKKVEGFLYRYQKGGEVSIICSCHGSFFSPSAFVKHAGGVDVSEPMKHITVNFTPDS